MVIRDIVTATIVKMVVRGLGGGRERERERVQKFKSIEERAEHLGQ